MNLLYFFNTIISTLTVKNNNNKIALFIERETSKDWRPVSPPFFIPSNWVSVSRLVEENTYQATIPTPPSVEESQRHPSPLLHHIAALLQNKRTKKKKQKIANEICEKDRDDKLTFNACVLFALLFSLLPKNKKIKLFLFLFIYSIFLIFFFFTPIHY